MIAVKSRERKHFLGVFSRIDFAALAAIALLLTFGGLAIYSATHNKAPKFFTSHLKILLIGAAAYFAFASFDYRRLRPSVPLLYIFVVVLLVGVLFAAPIQNVRRWYRIPLLPFALQPSELGKIAVIFVLSWLFDMFSHSRSAVSTSAVAIVLTSIPALLIYKQPDLGTSLILYPIMLGCMYFGRANRLVVGCIFTACIICLTFTLLLFTGVIPHRAVEPYALQVIKEYQFERFKPDSYHQKAGQTAIALGGIFGSGWKQSSFSKEGWLPFGHTDSVFCVITEEFGIVGGFVVIALYFYLFYTTISTAAKAVDLFGLLLASCIAVYILVHVLVNVGMMCGLLPITGVPLILMSAGGSSLVSTLILLGIVQSIHLRRFE